MDEEQMTVRCALILALFIPGMVPCTAQNGIGFGPLLGLYKARDADGYRIVGGAALRFRLSEIIGLEGSVNYREETYSHGSVDVTSWPVTVTGLLYPIHFVYGAIGAGWYSTSVRYNISPGSPGGLASVTRETKQQFGWHFGAGVELNLFSFVKLVGDMRYVILDYNFKSLPGSNGVISSSPVMTASLLFGL
jgi:opacity protein-like surface antigen